MGTKCEYKEFAELNRIFKISHVEKASKEQSLEVAERVIKTDPWLKNFPGEGNS